MSLEDNMNTILNTELKKGTKLVVEVKDVLGKDIVGMNVNMKGSNAAMLKMLLSAMATDKRLAQLIMATAAAQEFVRVDAVKFNFSEKVEEGDSL